MQSYLESAAKLTKLNSLDNNSSFKSVKEKSGLNPSSIVIISIVVLLILSMLISIHSFVIGFVCFLMPSFFSFLALQNDKKEDDTRFLMYWIIFSITEVQPITSMIMSPNIYLLFRIILTVLLLHPSTNLSYKIYQSGIKPLLEKHQQQLDQIIQKGKQKINKEIKNFNKTQ